MVDNIVGSGRRCNGEQQARIDPVQLASEFRQKRCVILLVFRPVIVSQPAADRIFPVDVDPVKHTDCRTGPPGVGGGVIGKVSEDQGVDTRRHKCLPVFRKCGIGKSPRPCPTAQCGKYLEMRVFRLELSQLVPVPFQRLVPGVGCSVNAFHGGHTPLVIGPGVTHTALGHPDNGPVIFDIDKSVVDMG